VTFLRPFVHCWITPAAAIPRSGDGAATKLQLGARFPEYMQVTTGPAPGQPGAAIPAAPRSGRAGLLVVPLVAVALGALVLGALAAVLVAALSRSGSPTFSALTAGTGLGVLGACSVVLWQRERRLTDALQRSQSSFRTLVKSSVDPVVILDERLRVTFASPSLADLLGLDPACRVVGTPIEQALHPDDAPTLIGALNAAPTESNELAVRTARVRHADGRWRLIQATVRDLRADPDVGALVLYCRDITAKVPAPGVEAELLELSLTDPVTGLPNRAALVRRLGAVQREAHGHRFALALVGISGLDTDALPPATEAAVLRALTSRLTRALRGEDWLARGKDGDFVVLVDGSVADAEIVASRLVANVGPLATPSGTLRLTAAAGVIALSPDLDTGEALRRGDLALRSARAAGPGSVHRYDDALRIAQDRRSALSTDLDSALDRGELRLVFQPVVDVVMHRTVSVEALLRWQHPLFGDVSPTEFVPLAEESPLITDLGRWVLIEACTTIAALGDIDLGVAVNVSARQVRSGELVPDVLAALETSGLPASRLIVEITESVLLDDKHVIEDLSALRQLGVRIAVDDFGTGWSSLAYLVGMPVDVLKMDQYFLSDVEHDPARRAMCRAVLQLGASLGLPVIVEGVTTPAQLTLLRDMGHRYLQGFFFSRPLEAAQLAAGAWKAGPELPTTYPPAEPAPAEPAAPAVQA
jgi:PAS domain S-box-containing protein/diguanylate cyclase (GGDEF)-like protein